MMNTMNKRRWSGRMWFCIALAMALQMASPARAQRFVKYVDSVQALKDLNVADVHASVFVRGYYAAQDGGEGFFWWNASDTTATNRGTVLKGKTTGSELATGRWNRLAKAGFYNVRWLGAKGDGSTDDTAAIVDAYNAISSTDGGELFFPVGKWKYNLVVAKQNVTITGSSHQRDNSGIGTEKNCFIAANTSLPVIQVGNDTAIVRGVMIRDVTLDGVGGGTMGVYFAGGAFECTMQNSAVTAFTTCIKVLGGTTYPASLIYFNRVDGAPNVSANNARGWLIVNAANYPTSYTTEIVLNNCHWDGPSSGTTSYVMEVDSCGVKMMNCYFDIHDGHGIKLSHNISTPLPILNAFNSNLDAGSSGNVAIEGYTNDRNFTGLETLNFKINGSWKELDGTVIAPLAQPIPTILRKSSAARGTLILLNQSGSDGTSLIQFRDQVNAKNPDIFAQSGSLNLRAEIGGGIKFGDNLGTAWGEVNTNGWFFYSGSLGVNTSVYLDSLHRLKSAPTGTATLDFPSTAAQTSSELTITATGATVGDCVILGVPATANANTCYTARVSAADTVTVKFNNYSSAAVDPASGTFKVTVLK